MKVALVHDYLIEFGGAERVLEALHEIYPEAPIYTAYADLSKLGPHKERVKKWNIKTSFLQKIPLAGRLISPLRIFAPLIFENFDLKEYDLVISSCNVYFSKAVITKPESLHISYIHTPPKMLYGYTTSFNYKKYLLIRIGAEIANHFLRLYDFEVSQRPDILVANSKNVKERINKFYRRDSVVIYPPVEIKKESKVTEEPEASKVEKKYFLSVSRLVRGKGVEIIVAACTKLNLPLKVVGSGPELERLKKIAGNSIEFLGHVSDEEREKLYESAKALIVATEEEDFGMTVPEAYSFGTPVIAAKSGGYLETVLEGKTGEFFKVSPNLGESKQYVDIPSVENLVKVLEKFDSKKYDEKRLKAQAEKYSKENFKKEILELVKKNLASNI